MDGEEAQDTAWKASFSDAVARKPTSRISNSSQMSILKRLRPVDSERRATFSPSRSSFGQSIAALVTTSRGRNGVGQR